MSSAPSPTISKSKDSASAYLSGLRSATRSIASASSPEIWRCFHAAKVGANLAAVIAFLT